MKIQVGGLSEGTHEFRFQVLPTELGLGEEFQHHVDVEATLEKTGHQMFLRVGIATEGSFVCDRCLAAFSLPLRSSYRMYYVSEGADMGHLDPSEAQVVPGGLTVIDISDDVRQTIVLSVPLKLLCRGDCKGLCPHCGTNLNRETCNCTEEARGRLWETLQASKRNLS